MDFWFFKRYNIKTRYLIETLQFVLYRYTKKLGITILKIAVVTAISDVQNIWLIEMETNSFLLPMLGV